MKKNIYEMSFMELGDEIEKILEEKMGQNLADKERDAMLTMRGCMRLMQFQMVEILGKAEMACWIGVAIMKQMTDEEKKEVIKEINKLKDDAQRKLMRDEVDLR